MLVSDLSQECEGNVKPEEEWPTDEYWENIGATCMVKKKSQILGQLETQVTSRSMGPAKKRNWPGLAQ